MESIFPDEAIFFSKSNIQLPEWKLYFDGAYNQKGAGIGAVLISEQGTHLPAATKILFEDETVITNNMAEY